MRNNLLLTCLGICYSCLCIGQVNIRSFKTYLYPDSITVQQSKTFRICLVVQKDFIPVGAVIKIRFVKGFSPYIFQSSNPNNLGYIIADCNNIKKSKINIINITNKDYNSPWGTDVYSHIINLKITDAALSKGDSINIILGANSIQGGLFAPKVAFTDSVKLAYYFDGKKLDELYSIPLTINSYLKTKIIKVYSPSTSVSNNVFVLKLITLDQVENKTTNFEGIVYINSTDLNAIHPDSVFFIKSDSGVKKINVILSTIGYHYLNLKIVGKDSTWKLNSPPIKVSKFKQNDIFWGDLHSHSSISYDGWGTGSYSYARDVSCLDFFSSAEHSSAPGLFSGIDDDEWKHIKKDVVNYYQPNQFVTILGYEFTAGAPSGHHNIYFNVSNDNIDNVPLYKVNFFPQIKDVWNNLKSNSLVNGIDILTIPHHTGIIFNKSTWTGPVVSFGQGYGDSVYRRTAEIYSGHGSSEYYAPNSNLLYSNLFSSRGADSGPHYIQDAWILGEKLGVVASSDNHYGQPGLNYTGLSAVYANNLTRNAIFDALKNRKTYATTGERILLDFSINNVEMGSEIMLNSENEINIHFEVAGTDSLDFVELLKWENVSNLDEFKVIKRKIVNGKIIIEDVIDRIKIGRTIYYIRAKQKNNVHDILYSVNNININREVWAWSSPIWVYKCNEVPKDKNIYLDVIPNPFKYSSLLCYYTDKDSYISIRIYDINGKLLKTLLNEKVASGWNHLDIYAENFNQGVYFFTISDDKKIFTKKIVILN